MLEYLHRATSLYCLVSREAPNGYKCIVESSKTLKALVQSPACAVSVICCQVFDLQCYTFLYCTGCYISHCCDFSGSDQLLVAGVSNVTRVIPSTHAIVCGHAPDALHRQ